MLSGDTDVWPVNICILRVQCESRVKKGFHHRFEDATLNQVGMFKKSPNNFKQN